MFSSRPNYLKLRTNMRLVINRLKLLEKKKTELALKSRVEIAEFIRNDKLDRARIRVESIIREDYIVEAMEMVEMYCDMLLARFGMIEKMTELDPGIEEAVATVLWVTPRLSSDVPELKEVSQQLAMKYSKEFAEMCRKNGLQNVNEKVISKLTISSPPKVLVENYMIEISKTYKVPFEPDPANLLGEVPDSKDLIALGFEGEKKHPFPEPSDDTSYPPVQSNPTQQGDQASAKPFNYPSPSQPPYPSQPLYPSNSQAPYPVYPPNEVPFASPFNLASNNLPSQPPQYVSNLPTTPPKLPEVPPNNASAGTLNKQMTWDDNELPVLPDIPTLPDVPTSHNPGASSQNDTIDFDDLSRRFEELKKK